MMAADNVGVITIADVIDKCWGFDSRAWNAAIAKLKAEGATSLKLVINSCGGDVIEALAIYDSIKACGMPIVAEVCGLCASAATVIALACDSVTMTSNSTWMTHEPTMCSIGTLAQIRSDCVLISNLRERIYAIYAKATGKAVEALQKDCEVDFWLTAQQAKEYGYVADVTGEDDDDAAPTDDDKPDEGEEARPAADDKEGESGKDDEDEGDGDAPSARGLLGVHAGLTLAARRGISILTPTAEAGSDETKMLRAQVAGLKKQLATALGRVRELTTGASSPSMIAVANDALPQNAAAALPAPVLTPPEPKLDPVKLKAEGGIDALVNATLRKKI